MPRIARIVIPQHPHLVRLRALAGRSLFPHPTDRGRFLAILGDYLHQQGGTLLQSRLEKREALLIVKLPEPAGMARALRNAAGFYSRCVNAREGTRGHLFHGRFASCSLEGSALHLAQELLDGRANPESARLLLSCLNSGQPARGEKSKT